MPKSAAPPLAILPDKTPADPKPDSSIKADGIHSKILLVMEGMGNIAKDKKNSFHNYSYVSDEAIVTKLRIQLIKHGLVVLPHQKSCTMTTIKDAKGQDTFLTTLEVEYTLVDIHSKETIKSSSFGYGKDKEDKGVYKAATGAEKYFLLKTFLIPTGDDPEADNGREPAPPRAQAPKDPSPPKVQLPETATINQETGNQLVALAKTKQITSEEFFAHLKVKRLGEIQISQVEEALKWLATLPARKSDEAVAKEYDDEVEFFIRSGVPLGVFGDYVESLPFCKDIAAVTAHLKKIHADNKPDKLLAIMKNNPTTKAATK